MNQKEEPNMTPPVVATPAKKVLDNAKVKAFIQAGGSVKTKHKIDSQELCRQARGKF